MRQTQYQSKAPRGRTGDEPVTGSSVAQRCTWGRMASLFRSNGSATAAYADNDINVLMERCQNWCITDQLRCKCGPPAGTRGTPDGCSLSHHAHSPWHEDKKVQQGLEEHNEFKVFEIIHISGSGVCGSKKGPKSILGR